MSKNKIIFFSKENLGGTGTFLSQITYINKNKFQTKFYFLKEDKYFKSKENSFLLNKTYPDYQKFSILKIVYFVINIYKIRRIIKDEDPGIIFACDLYSSISVFSLKTFRLVKGNAVSLVNTNLYSLAKDKPNKFYQELLIRTIKFLYRRADKLVFVSNDLFKGLQTKLCFKEKNSTVIQNSIDLKILDKKRSGNIEEDIKNIFSTNNFKIFSVGRLSKPKDFETVIKAFSIIHKEFPKTNLFIIGDGELKNNLIKLTQSLGVANYVKFLGWKENTFSYLAKADLFLFSSLYEGSSLVILEALAAGIPVIATNTPYGPSEILDKGKYGMLVPMGNYRKMAKEAEKLLENLALRKKYSEKAFKRAKEFDLKKMLEQYEKLFTEVINS